MPWIAHRGLVHASGAPGVKVLHNDAACQGPLPKQGQLRLAHACKHVRASPPPGLGISKRARVRAAAAHTACAVTLEVAAKAACSLPAPARLLLVGMHGRLLPTAVV